MGILLCSVMSVRDSLLRSTVFELVFYITLCLGVVSSMFSRYSVD